MTDSIQSYLELTEQKEEDLLIMVIDLANFTKFSRSNTSSEVFLKITQFNTSASDFTTKHGGMVIKYLGDACLSVFPKDKSSTAIMGLIKFKEEINKWLAVNMPGCFFAVNCHVGPVTLGPTPGFNGKPQIDVMGETVNTCFTMGNKGFIISPQAFRSLTPQARKAFKKFTPPIVYRHSESQAF